MCCRQLTATCRAIHLSLLRYHHHYPLRHALLLPPTSPHPLGFSLEHALTSDLQIAVTGWSCDLPWQLLLLHTRQSFFSSTPAKNYPSSTREPLHCAFFQTQHVTPRSLVETPQPHSHYFLFLLVRIFYLYLLRKETHKKQRFSPKKSEPLHPIAVILLLLTVSSRTGNNPTKTASNKSIFFLRFRLPFYLLYRVYCEKNRPTRERVHILPSLPESVCLKYLSIEQPR